MVACNFYSVVSVMTWDITVRGCCPGRWGYPLLFPIALLQLGQVRGLYFSIVSKAVLMLLRGRLGRETPMFMMLSKAESNFGCRETS